MIYTSLAVLMLSASAAVSPLSKLVHMHPHMAHADSRVSFTIRNQAPIFQDVKVAGRSYTLQPHAGLTIKAPVGTVVYSDSSTGVHKRGEVVADVTPQLSNQIMELR